MSRGGDYAGHNWGIEWRGQKSERPASNNDIAQRGMARGADNNDVQRRIEFVRRNHDIDPRAIREGNIREDKLRLNLSHQRSGLGAAIDAVGLNRQALQKLFQVLEPLDTAVNQKSEDPFPHVAPRLPA